MKSKSAPSELDAPTEHLDARMALELRTMGAEVERANDGLVFTMSGVRGRIARQGSEESGWIDCRVPMPVAAATFELDLRPETDEERRWVERGETLDVKLGDEPFDRAFVVEGAPSDIVAAVLDRQVRADLVALAPCRLRREGDELHLAVGSQAPTATVVGVCVRIAERLAQASEALEARDGTTRGDAYRSAPLLSRTAADERRAEEELEGLRELRRVRRQVRGFPVGATLIVTLVATALTGLWRHC